MCAEQAVTKVSREYRKFALKMAEMKNSMDREERLLVAREKAEKRGFEQGREQGIEQGIKKGIEQGIEQNKEEVIRNLLAMNMSMEVIAQAVNLPIEKIRALASE